VLHVERTGARQRCHMDPRELAADRIYRLKVTIGRDGKTGLEHIHTQIGQFTSHTQLFRYAHAAPRRLLPIAQRCIEDIYPAAHEFTRMELSMRPLVQFSKFIILPVSINAVYSLTAPATALSLKSRGSDACGNGGEQPAIRRRVRYSR